MAETVEITLDDAIQEFESSQSSFGEAEDYYLARERDIAVGIATPPQLRKLLAQVGLPRIYVSALAERLVIQGFRRGDDADADDELWGWFKANGLQTASQLGFIDSLVYGRSYITVSVPDEASKENPMAVPDIPIIRVESPKNLFAKIDPRTQDVVWAVRVVKDEEGQNVGATMYYPDRTEVYKAEDGELVQETVINHGAGVVPVVPVIRSEGVGDLYGTSILTTEIRSITDAMSRLLMNLQTTSELMATPQRMVFGSTLEELKGDAETPLEVYTASYIAIEDPSARAEQLPAAELRNFTEGISQLLKMAASYTGLPPQYLSFSSSNPSSAEAIQASEQRLIRTCEMLSDTFGDSWERAMRIALVLMGNKLTLDDFRMETVWRDPSTPTRAALADATSKAYANGSGYIPVQQARRDMGYSPEQIRQMEEWDNLSPTSQVNAMYSGAFGDEPSRDGEAAGEERQPGVDADSDADSGVSG